MLADIERLAEDVFAGDATGTGSGREEAGEHPESGGFTRSVGAEEADDFSASDLEGDLVDGGMASVFFGEMCDLDHFENFRKETRMFD